jgi:YD repeat-containing protein
VCDCSNTGGESVFNLTCDAAGNLTEDLTGPNTYTYTWDAEGRMVSARNNATQVTTEYTYNALGQRVKSSARLFGYGPGGEMLWWTDTNGMYFTDFIHAAGRRIAKVDPYGGTHYFFGDHLGSTRVMTDAAGQVQQEWVYYPFGQTVAEAETESLRYINSNLQDAAAAQLRYEHNGGQGYGI